MKTELPGWQDLGSKLGMFLAIRQAGRVLVEANAQKMESCQARPGMPKGFQFRRR